MIMVVEYTITLEAKIPLNNKAEKKIRKTKQLQPSMLVSKELQFETDTSSMRSRRYHSSYERGNYLNPHVKIIEDTCASRVRWGESICKSCG